MADEITLLPVEMNWVTSCLGFLTIWVSLESGRCVQADYSMTSKAETRGRAVCTEVGRW